MFQSIVRALACSVLLSASAFSAAQEAFPSKPIRIVVPYAAGGPADLIARLVGERLSPRIAQPVLIENRPGAGGHTGAEQVARGPADGYTLVLTTIAHNGAVKLYRNLRYDPTTELVPVALLAESPSVLLVNQTVPVNSLGELMALARSKPGTLNYGSAGNGSAMHMAAELFKHMAKIDYVHVPYKGGAPAMADLLGGQINMLFESVGTAHQHLRTGRVKALAVTSTQRNPSLPNVPTMAEAGLPGYASVPWYTLSAPRGTPAAAVNKLNEEVNAVLRLPELAQRLESLGVVPLPGSPADAQRRNVQETERWSAVIQAANLAVD